MSSIIPIEFEAQRLHVARAVEPHVPPADQYGYHGMPHGWDVSSNFIRRRAIWRENFGIHLPLRPGAFAGLGHDMGVHLDFPSDFFEHAEAYAASALAGVLRQQNYDDDTVINPARRIVASSHPDVALEELDEIAHNRSDLDNLQDPEATERSFFALYHEYIIKHPGTTLVEFAAISYSHAMKYISKDRPVHEKERAANGKSHWANKAIGSFVILHSKYPEFAEACKTTGADV